MFRVMLKLRTMLVRPLTNRPLQVRKLAIRLWLNLGGVNSWLRRPLIVLFYIRLTVIVYLVDGVCVVVTSRVTDVVAVTMASSYAELDFKDTMALGPNVSRKLS